MDKETAIKLFEDKRVRVLRDDDQEKWYFSIVDIIGVLSNSKNPQVYWRVLKKRLLDEGNESVTNCNALKMNADEGKMRLTEVADTEQLLRLIQSIPSPKAEPFKMWLARVGSERIDEMADPELAIERALETYLQKGIEYAILTDEITKSWAGFTTKEYKNFKGIKKENLRDNMTNLELVLNMLAEASTTEISKKKQPETFEQNKNVARQGGQVANAARKQLEETTGDKVVTNKNSKELKRIKE